jgi:hypothetical protein
MYKCLWMCVNVCMSLCLFVCLWFCLCMCTQAWHTFVCLVWCVHVAVKMTIFFIKYRDLWIINRFIRVEKMCNACWWYLLTLSTHFPLYYFQKVKEAITYKKNTLRCHFLIRYMFVTYCWTPTWPFVLMVSLNPLPLLH